VILAYHIPIHKSLADLKFDSYDPITVVRSSSQSRKQNLTKEDADNGSGISTDYGPVGGAQAAASVGFVVYTFLVPDGQAS
jgi:hypothetical protein